MTTAHLNAPAGVAGLEPDAGGGSNEPVAAAPVSKSLPFCAKAVSDAAGAFLIPATVGAAIGTAFLLRAILTTDGRLVLVLVLLGALLAGSVGVAIVGRRA